MKPRVGCLGLGWIGRARLQALVESGVAHVCAIADPNPAALDAAHTLVPEASRASSLDELLAHCLDGLVIATPSGQHAQEAIAALERGVAVFCQKPLAITAAEAAAAVRAAERSNRLLGVDMCYRHTQAGRALKALVESGGLGEIYLADVTFHNSYGPDKDWYYRRSLSGGGCVMDLGVHLVDQLIWLLDPMELAVDTSRLYRRGVAWTSESDEVEDCAIAQLTWTSQRAPSVRLEADPTPEGKADPASRVKADLMSEGMRSTGVARFACSWGAPTGHDATIAIEVVGTHGAGRVRNVAGSFYDFVAEHITGTTARTLVSPPDAWGGRALIAWAEQLASCSAYQPQCIEYVRLASVLDSIYAAAAPRHSEALPGTAVKLAGSASL